jgi:hypothetical protein
MCWTPILDSAYEGNVKIFNGGVISFSLLGVNAQLAVLVASIGVNLTRRTQEHCMISTKCYLFYHSFTVQEWPGNAEVTAVIVFAARCNYAEIFTKGKNSTCWRFA